MSQRNMPKRKMYFFIGVTLILAFILCPTAPLACAYPQNHKDLVKANNAFAWRLFTSIAEHVKRGNVFMSPFSLSSGLAMLYAGSDGETKSQMEAALAISSDSATFQPLTLHQAYKDLLEVLEDPVNNYTLRVANRLFMRKGYALLESYLNTTREYYTAEAEMLDFAVDSKSATDRINDWVANKTELRIPQLIEYGTVDAMTALVLVNAIYFNGGWKQPFDSKNTKPAPFYISTGEQVQMDMMTSSKQKWRHAHVPQWDSRILELAYVGDEVAMYIILPNDGITLSSVEGKITCDELEIVLDRLIRDDIYVSIPKFRLTQTINMRSFLEDLGMVDVFSFERADLSRISGSRGLSVTEVVHKAFVEVDEKGTEAAGATGISVVLTALMPDVDPFIANRPFLFMIVEKTTRSTLFLGRLTSPPEDSVSVGAFARGADTNSARADLTHTFPILAVALQVTLFTGLWCS